MKHYFRKAIPQMKLRDDEGEVIPFDALNQSWSFLDLDDEDPNPKHKKWVAQLDAAIKSRSHGVDRITEAQWSELYIQKKTPNYKQKLPDFLGGMAGDGRAALQSGSIIAPDSAGKRVDLAEVEASKVQPKTPELAEAKAAEKSASTPAPKPTVGKLPKAPTAE